MLVDVVFCLVGRSYLIRFVFRTHLTKFMLRSNVMMFSVGCIDVNSEPMVVLRRVLGSVSVSVTSQQITRGLGTGGALQS